MASPAHESLVSSSISSKFNFISEPVLYFYTHFALIHNLLKHSNNACSVKRCKHPVLLLMACSRSIFVASKNSIFQYNTRTGKEIYQYKGWGADVIGFDFHVIDSLECLIGCSKSGELIVWKTANKIVLFEAVSPFLDAGTEHFAKCFTANSQAKRYILWPGFGQLSDRPGRFNSLQRGTKTSCILHGEYQENRRTEGGVENPQEGILRPY